MSYINVNTEDVKRKCDNCGKTGEITDGIIIPKGWILFGDRRLDILVQWRGEGRKLKQISIQPEIGGLYLDFCCKNCVITYIEKKIDALEAQKEVEA